MEFEHLDLRVLLEHAHIGVVIHRWDTSIVYANPTALRLLRLTYDQVIGKDAFDPGWYFLDEYGYKLPLEDYPVNKVIQSDGRLENEIIGVIDSSRAEISWFLLNAYAEGVSEETGKFIVVTFNDITESKHLFSFQDIVERTQDIVLVTEAKNIDDLTGPKIIYVNKAFEKLTGYTREEALGETPRMLQGALTDKGATRRIRMALKKKEAVTETVLNYDKKGRPYWIEMNITPLTDINGEVSHFAAIERDVSERKFHLEQLEQRNKDLKALKDNLELHVEKRTAELQEANTKLKKLAFFDHLTQLPNRRYFIDHALRIMKAGNRHRELVAFGVLDLDLFKCVNDTYGHDVGDLVLIALGHYFRDFFRMDDAFCRFGGEEFAFAVSSAAIENVGLIAERLIKGIRELRIDIGDNSSLSVTASLGIKVCIPSEDTDFEEQMKLADQGLYQAKQSGRDQYVILPPCSE